MGAGRLEGPHVLGSPPTLDGREEGFQALESVPLAETGPEVASCSRSSLALTSPKAANPKRARIENFINNLFKLDMVALYTGSQQLQKFRRPHLLKRTGISSSFVLKQFF